MCFKKDGNQEKRYLQFEDKNCVYPNRYLTAHLANDQPQKYYKNSLPRYIVYDLRGNSVTIKRNLYEPNFDEIYVQINGF